MTSIYHRQTYKEDIDEAIVLVQARLKGLIVRRRVAANKKAHAAIQRRATTKYEKRANSTNLDKREYPDGSYYLGGIKNNVREGRGKQVWPDGTYYQGEWKNDCANGEGIFSSASGRLYDGHWENDKASGHGKLFILGKFVYEGEWKGDKQHGMGNEVFPDGTVYEGQYDDGIRHGKGKIQIADGYSYEGDWVNNAIEGIVIQSALLCRENSHGLMGANTKVG